MTSQCAISDAGKSPPFLKRDDASGLAAVPPVQADHRPLPGYLYDGVGLNCTLCAKVPKLDHCAHRGCHRCEGHCEQSDRYERQARDEEADGLSAPNPPNAKLVEPALFHGLSLYEALGFVRYGVGHGWFANVQRRHSHNGQADDPQIPRRDLSSAETALNLGQIKRGSER